MGFIHSHTKGEWKAEIENSLCFSIQTDNGTIAEIYDGLNNLSGEIEGNKNLISQAPKLLEFAEMMYDQYVKNEKKPFFFKQLQETIEKSGVEITHKPKQKDLKEGINVLSLFDGMSCGQIALNRSGFKVENYFASEIDKHGIKVCQENFPETKQLGDVSLIDLDSLPKIDLLIGGSPCQGFSFAGKQLNFNDPRSALFFEFVKIYKFLKNKNPEIKFILENVVMKKDYQKVITEQMGVEPIMINSSLVSAQNRKRLYWSNIKEINQPKDRKILMNDILLEKYDSKYLMKENWGKWWDKNSQFQIKKKYSAVNTEKAICMVARQYSNWNGNFIFLNDCVLVKEATKLGFTKIEEGNCVDLTFLKSKTRRGRSMKEKSNCMTASKFDFYQYKKGLFRRLTPVECERLQTVPDEYTSSVSDNQRYKMLGNGWTVDVICHILENINK